jgi:hypothetical protein
VSLNGILVEAKMCTFTLESTHFIFNKCSIYNHDGASAKFSTNTHETDYSVRVQWSLLLIATADSILDNFGHDIYIRIYICRGFVHQITRQAIISNQVHDL